MSPISASAKRRVVPVLLRLPAGLHRALVRAAAAEGISLNSLCVKKLGAPAHPHAGSAARSAVLERAQGLFGDQLIGCVVLGSWARGEAAATSDIDVLIVIDPVVPLTRELYRRWDSAPLAFEGRDVDAHFVHTPIAGAPPAALWCEAAVDGLVWHDRDSRVTNHLADVRRAIAEGRIVRGHAHGQPYWKGAA